VGALRDPITLIAPYSAWWRRAAVRPVGACQRASCRRGPASPTAPGGAVAAWPEPSLYSPAVPSPCHSGHDATGLPRSTTDTHGPLTCGRLKDWFRNPDDYDEVKSAIVLLLIERHESPSYDHSKYQLWTYVQPALRE
jgi:hypothetical protein